jgi:serine-type D-Ala-D-Ala carboxypeptidase
MQGLDTLLQQGVGEVYTAASVEVRQDGQTIYRTAVGDIDPNGRQGSQPTRLDTRFDLASLTKLFTTTTFLRLVDAGKVALDMPVCQVLPEFSGSRSIAPYEHPLNPGEVVEVVPPTDEQVDAGAVTFCHLLTHSSGLPAWKDLHRADDEIGRLRICLTTPFAYPTGSRVVYSDVGLILVGLSIERLTGQPLDTALRTLVLDPLGIAARYGPIPPGNVAPTEICPWRKRRLIGEVDDENAATLHGVAGHAGLFGTAADVAALGQLYLDGGQGLISAELVRDATRTHIATDVENRGLGWMIQCAVSPAPHFSADSYGHTGFTGTSIWVDPQRKLVCVLLTNRVFFGRMARQIDQFRPLFHDTLIESLAAT